VRGAPRAPAQRPAASLRRCLGSSLRSACAPATATAVVLGAGGPGFQHRNLPSAGSRSGHQAGERGRRRGCRFAIRMVGVRWEGGTRPSTTTQGFNLRCWPGCLPNYIHRNLSVWSRAAVPVVSLSCPPFGCCWLLLPGLFSSRISYCCCREGVPLLRARAEGREGEVSWEALPLCSESGSVSS